MPTSGWWRAPHSNGSTVDHALVVVDLEPDVDPPRVLAIRSDVSCSLLEIIWLEFADRASIVIQAMPLRRTFYGLLPRGEDGS